MIVVEAVNDASPATLISSPAAAPSPLSEIAPPAITVSEPVASISPSSISFRSSTVTSEPAMFTTSWKSCSASLSSVTDCPVAAIVAVPEMMIARLFVSLTAPPAVRLKVSAAMSRRAMSSTSLK